MRRAFVFSWLLISLLALAPLCLGQSQEPGTKHEDSTVFTGETNSRYKNIPQQLDRIRSRGNYQDYGAKQDNTWMSSAGRSLSAFLKKAMESVQPNQNFDGPELGQGPRMGGMPNLSFLVYVVWAILIGFVLFLAYYAFRHFGWKAKLKRKAKAILEDDEPERTLDEWLDEADRLAKNGKHREACRALYLACLLRYDEAGIARFLRGETNWEHLYRIQTASPPEKPFNFEPATRAFDRVWYGFRVQGQSDVDQFRAWYVELTKILGGSAFA